MRFTVKDNRDARLAILGAKERAIARIQRSPMVVVYHTATGPAPSTRVSGAIREGRTDAKNTIVFRTHRKRVGGMLRIGARDAKAIMKATAELRALVKSGKPGALKSWAAEVGKGIVNRLRAGIRQAGLYDSGQLLNSLTHKGLNT